MRFYGDICRVDEEQRMVWGYASTEQRALDGLVISRDAMSGALDEYMEYANIREMHQPSAVGVAREALVDEKGLYIGAYVVDDDAWKKVVERVYKAFSIGCKITERDATDRTLVTGISLREISLVDRPSDPGAKFDCFRAADFDEDELDDEGDDLERRQFNQEQRDKMATTGEALPDGSYPIANRQDLENAIRAFGRAKNKRAVKRHIMRRAKALGAMDLIPEEWKSDMKSRAADVEGELDNNDGAGAAEAVERSDPTGEAVEGVQDPPAGQEPAIEAAPEGEVVAEGAERVAEGAETVETAAEGAEPAKSEVELAVEAARAAAAGLREAVEGADEPEEAVERVIPGAELRRGIYTVGRLGALLAELAYITQDAQFESEIEGDNSPVPGKMRAAVLELAKAYKAMSDEELAELVNGVGVDVQLENGVIMLCAASGGLERDGADLSEDQINRLHDAFSALEAHGFKVQVQAAEPEPNSEMEELRRAVEAGNADREVLLRTVGDLTSEIRTTQTKLSEIMQRVAPAKTAGPAVSRVVGKGEDASGQDEGSVERVAPLSPEEVQRHLDGLPALERAELLTRAALARPMSLADVRSPRIASSASE